VPAVSEAHLDTIARTYLPAVVVNATRIGDQAAVDVLWQVNSQKNGGFVLELSNEWGVTKEICDTMKLDPAGAVRASILVMKDAIGAVDWVSGNDLHQGPIAAGTILEVVVPPGNTSFVAFSPFGLSMDTFV